MDTLAGLVLAQNSIDRIGHPSLSDEKATLGSGISASSMHRGKYRQVLQVIACVFSQDAFSLTCSPSALGLIYPKDVALSSATESRHDELGFHRSR